jgi:hypothetical protein
MSCSKNNAQNIIYMPALIFFAILNLRQISVDFENPHFWTGTSEQSTLKSLLEIGLQDFRQIN